MLWFDKYERLARAAPGLLALLPIAVVGIVVGLRQNPVVSALVGVVVAAGGPLVLAGLVRSRGLDLQRTLFAKWGTAPTTALLLLGEATSNTALRDQRRRDAERVTGVTLLTQDDEVRQSQRARELAEAAVTVLRERTRETDKFPLVAAENRNYGFERNLYAIRTLGITLSAAASLVLAAMLILVASHKVHHAVTEVLVAVAVSICLFFVWMFYPSEARVRAAADKYAGSLLDASATL